MRCYYYHYFSLFEKKNFEKEGPLWIYFYKENVIRRNSWEKSLSIVYTIRSGKKKKLFRALKLHLIPEGREAEIRVVRTTMPTTVQREKESRKIGTSLTDLCWNSIQQKNTRGENNKERGVLHLIEIQDLPFFQTQIHFPTFMIPLLFKTIFYRRIGERIFPVALFRLAPTPFSAKYVKTEK